MHIVLCPIIISGNIFQTPGHGLISVSGWKNHPGRALVSAESFQICIFCAEWKNRNSFYYDFKRTGRMAVARSSYYNGLFCPMLLFCIFYVFGLQIYRVWVRVRVRAKTSNMQKSHIRQECPIMIRQTLSSERMDMNGLRVDCTVAVQRRTPSSRSGVFNLWSADPRWSAGSFQGVRGQPQKNSRPVAY